MDKKEQKKITPALLKECMRVHEKYEKSGELPTAFHNCVFSTPVTPQQKQEENSKDSE